MIYHTNIIQCDRLNSGDFDVSDRYYNIRHYNRKLTRLTTINHVPMSENQLFVSK